MINDAIASVVAAGDRPALQTLQQLPAQDVGDVLLQLPLTGATVRAAVAHLATDDNRDLVRKLVDDDETRDELIAALRTADPAALTPFASEADDQIADVLTAGGVAAAALLASWSLTSAKTAALSAAAADGPPANLSAPTVCWLLGFASDDLVRAHATALGEALLAFDFECPADSGLIDRYARLGGDPAIVDELQASPSRNRTLPALPLDPSDPDDIAVVVALQMALPADLIARVNVAGLRQSLPPSRRLDARSANVLLSLRDDLTLDDLVYFAASVDPHPGLRGYRRCGLAGDPAVIGTEIATSAAELTTSAQQRGLARLLYLLRASGRFDDRWIVRMMPVSELQRLQGLPDGHWHRTELRWVADATLSLLADHDPGCWPLLYTLGSSSDLPFGQLLDAAAALAREGRTTQQAAAALARRTDDITAAPF